MTTSATPSKPPATLDPNELAVVRELVEAMLFKTRSQTLSTRHLNNS
jgi:hypothetical protein